MDAAVAKHGPVKPPQYTHIQEFYNRIDLEKEKIVKAA